MLCRESSTSISHLIFICQAFLQNFLEKFFLEVPQPFELWTSFWRELNYHIIYAILLSSVFRNFFKNFLFSTNSSLVPFERLTRSSDDSLANISHMIYRCQAIFKTFLKSFCADSRTSEMPCRACRRPSYGASRRTQLAYNNSIFH